MKQTIHIIGSSTTIERTIKSDIVKYNNERFRVFESHGSYQIDLTQPIRQELDRFSGDDIMDKARQIMQSRVTAPGSPPFDSPDTAKDYFLTQHFGLKAERFDMAMMDNRHRLIEFRPMFHGTIDSASVYPREVVRACMEANAAAIF